VYFPIPHSTFVKNIYICEVKKLGQTEISTLKYKYFAKLYKTYKWSERVYSRLKIPIDTFKKY
jgi:hypothetical protein